MNNFDELPNSLEVSQIQKILNCGRRQAYELINSGEFHVVRIGTRIKVSKRVFFEWYEGKEFTEWLEKKCTNRG
ncbi:helix-turn-helix domain-containing protein [Brevibacillus laterosporus]|uniref:Helix-turn-helix domain-containing protein n=1 Tax=Brevibacillus halotolerans TaxID=1507437 RepID=A0ABT4HZN8_9BACL|nr:MULTISPECIES: helix-turn-helix domain-containing protein [Brevibacillus]MCR8986034.1 helix-turn-helix domain-containing protein [Brevibacillus laterosporus]MCZ0831767.1 helix-turn-helix domain-containing protein [Brevibacillus halotolerans]